MTRRCSWLGRPLVVAGVSTAVIVGTAGVPRAAASVSSSGATYVALGDSYASGEGLGPFQSGTDVNSGAHKNTCHRSVHDAYADLSPPIVLPGVRSRALWACSGATVADMQNVPGRNGTPAQYGQPAQTATVGGATDYVTLTVGGDDLGFAKIASACAAAEIFGHIVHFSSSSCGSIVTQEKAKIPALVVALEQLYRTVLARSAPSSELVVAGYPRIFPTSFAGLGDVHGQPWCSFDHLFAIGTIGMPVPDAKAVAAFESALNGAARSAVSAVGALDPGRIRFADIYPTSVPRTCRGYTRHATVAGFELSPAGNGIGSGWKRFVSSATFHPTTDGQQVYARAIQQQFAG